MRDQASQLQQQLTARSDMLERMHDTLRALSGEYEGAMARLRVAGEQAAEAAAAAAAAQQEQQALRDRWARGATAPSGWCRGPM